MCADVCRPVDYQATNCSAQHVCIPDSHSSYLFVWTCAVCGVRQYVPVFEDMFCGRWSVCCLWSCNDGLHLCTHMYVSRSKRLSMFTFLGTLCCVCPGPEHPRQWPVVCPGGPLHAGWLAHHALRRRRHILGSSVWPRLQTHSHLLPWAFNGGQVLGQVSRWTRWHGEQSEHAVKSHQPAKYVGGHLWPTYFLSSPQNNAELDYNYYASMHCGVCSLVISLSN